MYNQSRLSSILRPEDRLFFIHIPKTAGTTLIPLIDMHFAANEICPAQLWREFGKLPQETLADYRLFRGHFGGDGLNTFLPSPPVCMTMLRKPVPLSLSTYKFILREPGTRVHDLVKSNNMSFADFLEHSKTQPKVSNKQVRHLSFDLEHDPETGPIFDSSESRAEVDRWIKEHKTTISPNERFERARAKLLDCAFFGLVERFDESMALMAYTFNWPPVGRIQKLRVAPKKQGSNELEGETLDRVLELNQQDTALYDLAEQVFDQRLTAMYADLAARFGTSSTTDAPDAEQLDSWLDQHYLQHRWGQQSAAANDHIRIDFDQPIFGQGWHRREASSIDGSTFCWTGPTTESFIDMATNSQDDARLTIHIINWLIDDIIESLCISANGKPLRDLQTIESQGGTRTLQGIVPAEVMAEHRGRLRVQLHVGRVMSPQQREPRNPDGRNVGVAVNWIHLEPANRSEPGQVPAVKIDHDMQAELDRRRSEARSRELKSKIAQIPVVGPKLRELYIKRKSR